MGTAAIDLLISLPILGFAAWGLGRGAGAYLKSRGARIVTCPETGGAAAVDLAAWRIAGRAIFRQPELRLRSCSERRGRAPCEQPCLRQIESALDGCRMEAILSRWYWGKTCICCGRSFGQVGRWNHRPCLMSPDLRIIEWTGIAPEHIPQTLATHEPVCWTCYVAETHTS